MNLIIKFFRKEPVIICFFLIVKLSILFIADINGGFNGDEAMHIDSGHHLALGFITFQPLIGIMAWIQNLFNSDSIFIHHLFSHIAAATIIVVCGLTTLKLGGSYKALILALSCIIAAPGFGVTNNAFTPMVFEQLVIVCVFYFLVCYCQENASKYLLYIAILFAIGFLIKISVVFVMLGLLISFILFERIVFRNKILYLAIVIALLISPNIIWQYQHDFPSLAHMNALYKTILNDFDWQDNLKLFVLSLNPINLFVWGVAIFLVPFTKSYSNMRIATFTLLFSFLLLVVAKAQFYYMFPIMLFAFCLGSVYFERLIASKKLVMPFYIALIIVSGVFIIPLGLPLLPINTYVKYGHFDQHKVKVSSSLFYNKEAIKGETKSQNSRIPLNFEEYYTANDWNNLVCAVNKVYSELPPDEKSNCKIWTLNYIQSGAINLLGDKYHLPESFSFHASYYNWVPDFPPGITIIAVGQSYRLEEYVWPMKYFGQYVDSIELKESIFCPYARQNADTYYHVFLCKGLKYDSEYLKKVRKVDVF
jgi:hypothetical protein